MRAGAHRAVTHIGRCMVGVGAGALVCVMAAVVSLAPRAVAAPPRVQAGNAPAAGGSASIYWTDRFSIGQANIDGSGVDQSFMPRGPAREAQARWP